MLCGKRILVVDDEVVFAENLRQYFSKRLARVMSVGSGEAALEMASRFQPDVVILADRLPAMGGIETFQLLKTRLPGVNCILVTDRGSDVLWPAARAAGVDHLLEKPFPLSELESIVSAGASPAAGVAARPADLPAARWEEAIPTGDWLRARWRAQHIWPSAAA